jgi:lactoylglutathione lyase
MIKQIATVALYVADQAAAKRFWTEQVGFELVAEHPMGPNATWLEVAPPGAQSRLVLYPKQMMPNWAEMKPSIVFECEDIQGTFAAMKSRGVTFIEEPKTMPWGSYARFQDIDGNEFVIKG